MPWIRKALILGFSFFNQKRSISWPMRRSVLISKRLAPSGVPRPVGIRLDAFREARNRAIIR